MSNELLQQIKDKVAKDHYSDYEGWIELDLQEEKELWPIVCERYAAACVEERSKTLSELWQMKVDAMHELFKKECNAKDQLKTNIESMFTKQQVEGSKSTIQSERFWTFKYEFYQVDKSSITDPKNITIPEI